ncbi:MAG: MFS transporter [Candidatus Lokiarchaeota archaeon]|nr:MFS transporter [Candidatus Lokiarchaeota archaeon]
MEKRHSNLFLYISYFLSQFCIYFINPFLSLDSLKSTSPRMRLFIAILIWVAPFFAQATTMYLFSWIAEKKRNVRFLVIVGFGVNLVQFVALYFVNRLTNNSYLLLLVTGVCNLFIVAYIPAIKTYLSSHNIKAKNRGKSLSSINIVESLSWAIGILVGSILYDLVPLFIMILIAIALSAVTIILIPLLPVMVTPETSDKTLYPDPSLADVHPPYQSILSFKEALIYQFILLFAATSFFGLLSAYLQFLDLPTWFFGLSNAIPGILAIFMFYLFGRILDRFGPNTLYHFGWISYLLVYLGLLSNNVVIIFLVWIWPAYTFRLSTEYLASHQWDKSQAIRNMALAGFVNIAGIVFGNLFGGILTLFSDQLQIQFRIVLLASIIGIFLVGVSLVLVHIMRKRKMAP